MKRTKKNQNTASDVRKKENQKQTKMTGHSSRGPFKVMNAHWNEREPNRATNLGRWSAATTADKAGYRWHAALAACSVPSLRVSSRSTALVRPLVQLYLSLVLFYRVNVFQSCRKSSRPAMRLPTFLLSFSFRPIPKERNRTRNANTPRDIRNVKPPPPPFLPLHSFAAHAYLALPNSGRGSW